MFRCTTFFISTSSDVYLKKIMLSSANHVSVTQNWFNEYLTDYQIPHGSLHLPDLTPTDHVSDMLQTQINSLHTPPADITQLW